MVVLFSINLNLVKFEINRLLILRDVYYLFWDGGSSSRDGGCMIGNNFVFPSLLLEHP